MMVDTNIIIDLRERDARWYDWSSTAVASSNEPVSASAIVIGELAMRTAHEDELSKMLTGFGIVVKPLNSTAAFRAGLAHRGYRQSGGTREKLLADFLIGAHACAESEPLLTRDPRWYRSYFPELTLITPESNP